MRVTPFFQHASHQVALSHRMVSRGIQQAINQPYGLLIMAPVNEKIEQHLFHGQYKTY
jgi:hypothetical protein